MLKWYMCHKKSTPHYTVCNIKTITTGYNGHHGLPDVAPAPSSAPLYARAQTAPDTTPSPETP